MPDVCDPAASIRLPRILVLAAAVCATYALTARAGLALAETHESASAVWAPSGLALGVVLRAGRRLWPAIAIGALIAALTYGLPLGAALTIGIGASLEALAGAWLLSRMSGFQRHLERVRDVVAFALVAAASVPVSALLGVGSLVAFDLLTTADAWAAARVWALGDLTGILLVGPLVLASGPVRMGWPRGRDAVHAAAVALVVLASGVGVFTVDSPMVYLCLPALVWAALAFGRAGAVAASAALSVVAMLYTAQGLGPFAHASEGLLEAQLFACVCALTGLLVAAVRSERRASERRLIEREASVEALARAEQQTRAIIDSAHDAFVAIDAQGRVIDWNRQAEATFGYAREEILGRTLTETIVPERLRDAHRQGIERFLAGGESRVVGQRRELPALRRDGREIPVELTINPVATADGWGFTAFLQDVSEQRRHEAHLAAEYAVARVLAESDPAEARGNVLRALGEKLGWAVALWWEVHAEHGALRCEAAWHATPRDTIELEVLARSVTLARGDELLGRVWAARRQRLAGRVDGCGGERSEAALAAGLRGVGAIPLTSAGEVVGVIELLTAEPGRADADLGRLLAGLADKIGEHVARTRAQDAIAELARHFETSQDLLCTAGFDGYYRSLNPRWEAVLGWTPDELRARSSLAFMHPDDRPVVQAVVSRLANNSAPVRFECRHACRDGGFRTIAWVATVSPDGTLYGSGRDVTERVETEQALSLQAEIARNMAEGVLLVRTSDWRIVFANSKLAATFGYEPGELEGTAVELLTPPEHERVQPGAPVQSALRDGGSFSGEVENIRKDGTRFWSLVTISNFDHPEHGEVSVAVHSDITAEKAARAALAEAEERFRRAFEDAGAGMALLGVRGDDAGRFLEVNDALCDITGCTREELLATGIAQITHVDDLGPAAEAMRRLLAGELTSYHSEKRLVAADGQVVWVAMATSLVRDRAGQPLHCIAQLQDVSERKHFEGQLQHLADHDSLTGLFNRRRFEQELGRELAAARRYGTGGAVLALDVDNFKYVNDSLGHAAGDELIVKVAQVIEERLRESDVVARLGGDEFAVVLPHADIATAREVASDLVGTIRRDARVMTDTGARRVTASVGIASFHDQPGKIASEDLLVEADIAMYDAKEAGRDQVAVFDAQHDRQARMHEHLTWADRIREALEENRFVLHAQPILALGEDAPATRRYELLVRMLGDGGELVPPNTFLPVAERSNLITDLDRWVVRRAVGLLAEQQRVGLDVAFAINLSARSMSDEQMPEFVAREIAATGVDPARLVFEITETAAIVNVHRARGLAARLRELGCRLSLDDFGAGFASFHYLKHLDFDELKIDGEFIQDLAASQTNRLVVRAIVEMARGMGKATIAEYVEDAATLELLRGWGIDYAQGYHVGRPQGFAAAGLRPWPAAPRLYAHG